MAAVKASITCGSNWIPDFLRPQPRVPLELSGSLWGLFDEGEVGFGL